MASRFAGAVAALVLVPVLAACSGSDTDPAIPHPKTTATVLPRDTNAGVQPTPSPEPMPAPEAASADSDSCAACVFALMRSSSHFKKECYALIPAIERNGGALGWTLDSSPYPERHGASNESPRFAISVFESYPSHNHTLHRYTFSPSTERLAVELLIDDFDGPRDSTLRYDPALLPAFRRHCGEGTD